MRDRTLILGLGKLGTYYHEDIERNSLLLSRAIASSIEEVVSSLMGNVPRVTLRGTNVYRSDEPWELPGTYLTNEQGEELYSIKHAIHGFLDNAINEFHMRYYAGGKEYCVNVDHMLMNRTNVVISCSVYPT